MPLLVSLPIFFIFLYCYISDFPPLVFTLRQLLCLRLCPFHCLIRHGRVCIFHHFKSCISHLKSKSCSLISVFIDRVSVGFEQFFFFLSNISEILEIKYSATSPNHVRVLLLPKMLLYHKESTVYCPISKVKPCSFSGFSRWSGNPLKIFSSIYLPYHNKSSVIQFPVINISVKVLTIWTFKIYSNID